jgi:hypothetical protein
VAETIIVGFEVIDIDQQQSQRAACGGCMLDGAAAVRFKGMSIECARKRIAPRAREQVFIPLAVSQRVEYIPYPRSVLVPPDGRSK